MDQYIQGESQNMSDDEWILILLFLWLEDAQKKDNQWDKFELDLIYKNRFSSDSPIVEEIHKQSNRATKTIKAGSMFYRARSFNSADSDKLLEYYLKATGKTKAEIKEAVSNLSDYQKELMLLGFNNRNYNYSDDDLVSKEIIKAQRKWKRNVKYKGYDAKNSTAPKANLVSNGRANPDHIRYLYLCEDDITPIYEIRPIIGETVSVAKFKLLRDVKVYDLTLSILDESSDSSFAFTSLYNSIGKMFSRPHNGDVSKYLPTQFLSEEIKKMGFDGLRFNSSLYESGINLVLFNPEDCKAVSSDLVEVKSIKIGTDIPNIYKIGTFSDATVPIEIK